jgi:hypothetical protein
MPVLSRRDFLILSGTGAASVLSSQLFPWPRQRPVRVAIAATRLSAADITHIAGLPEIELVALSGEKYLSAVTLQLCNSPIWYNNATSLARSVPADIVLVRVPEPLQPSILRTLINRNIPVLVETPVSSDLKSISRHDSCVQLLPRRVLTSMGAGACMLPTREFGHIDIRHSFVMLNAGQNDSPEAMIMLQIGDALTSAVDLLQADRVDSCYIAYASGTYRKRHSLAMVFRVRNPERVKLLTVTMEWLNESEECTRISAPTTALTARSGSNQLVAHFVPRPAHITSLYIRNTLCAFEQAKPEALLHPAPAAESARQLVQSAVAQMNPSTKHAVCRRV